MTCEVGTEVTTPSDSPGLTPLRRRLSSVLIPLVLAVVGVSALGAYGIHRYGSFSRLIDYLYGETLVLDENDKRLGPMSVGESRAVVYQVTNLTERHVRVLGIVTACSCTAVEEAPDLVPPRTTLPIRVRFMPKQQQVSDRYVGKVRIFTDDTYLQQLELTFEARVVGESGPQ